MNFLKPSPMQHMSLFMLINDVPMASVILASNEAFDLSRANQNNQLLPENYAQDYVEQFESALERCKKIISFLDINLNEEVKDVLQISFEKLTKTNQRLEDIWKKCISFDDQQRRLNEKNRFITNLKNLLDNISVFDVDLSLLDDGLYFLDIELGIMPSAHVTRLKSALSIDGYLLTEYMQHGEYSNIIVAGLKEHRDKVQSLLYSANYKKIHIPVDFRDHPQKIRDKIRQIENQYHAERKHYKQNLIIFRDKYKKEIKQLGDVLTLAKPYTLLSQKMQGIGDLINISGWMLEAEVQSVTNQLQQALHNRVIISVRKPEPHEYTSIPSYIKHNQWMSPFIKLLKNYGVPRYNEFDPSWFFTLSYILMFGMMFGDIGHGLLFIALSFFLRKKYPDVALFLTSVGLSSTVFGFIYGSIFCYEHIIPAIWQSPLSDPLIMLQLALLWGIVFIIILNVFAIINRLLAFDIRNALFDGHGLSGLILYCILLWLLYELINETFELSYLLLMLIPLVFIVLNKWFHSNEPYTERLLITFIECYELMVNYLANTISFLRLAAFSLNHVALAVSVITIANMVDGATHWLVIILGNLFIYILEGAVVGIQTLRLEYYEGFSRFYYADGYLFEPLNLSPKKL